MQPSGLDGPLARGMLLNVAMYLACVGNNRSRRAFSSFSDCTMQQIAALRLLTRPEAPAVAFTCHLCCFPPSPKLSSSVQHCSSLSQGHSQTLPSACRMSSTSRCRAPLLGRCRHADCRRQAYAQVQLPHRGVMTHLG